MGTTCSTYIQIHMKQVRMKLQQITSLHAPYNFQWSKNSLYVSRIISRHWSHSIEDSTFSYLYVRICRSRLWNRINLICNSIEKIAMGWYSTVDKNPKNVQFREAILLASKDKNQLFFNGAYLYY